VACTGGGEATVDEAGLSLVVDVGTAPSSWSTAVEVLEDDVVPSVVESDSGSDVVSDVFSAVELGVVVGGGVGFGESFVDVVVAGGALAVVVGVGVVVERGS
jgi:hypothetical protein